MNEFTSVGGDRLNAVLEEFIARLRKGERPSIESYAADHPELAADLRRLLPALLVLEAPPNERSSVPASLETATAFAADVSASGPSPLAAGIMFGRYRIIKPLGEGGMGSVFVAEDSELKRLVALKIPRLAARQNPDTLARFYREAKAAAALSHPGICPIYGFGETDGTPYLAMAYVRGRLLSDRLASEPITEREAAELIRGIAVALQFAHRNGVIHRDLKPQNVMLDEHGRPILLDFGLARQSLAAPETVTQSGLVMGTPAYISPEQAEGRSRAIGPSCDVYSLGVMFYEMLAGRRPFQGSAAELIGKHLYMPPESPAAHRPGLDPALGALCLRMLAKAPDERPSSMNDIAAALEAWLIERTDQIDEEDAAGRLGWWLPLGLVAGGLAIIYFAWWMVVPSNDSFDVLYNLVVTGLFGLIGVTLWGLAGMLTFKRWRRRQATLRATDD